MANLAQNAVQAIVEDKLRRIENKGLIVSYRYSFMEHFNNTLTEEEIDAIKEKYPFLYVDERMVEFNGMIHYLFIARGGYYECFYSADPDLIVGPDDTDINWIWTTNHDSCWRDNAFPNFDIQYQIQSAILDIAKQFGIKHISIPKHVIPNFEDIRIGKMFKFGRLAGVNKKAINNFKYVDRSELKDGDEIIYEMVSKDSMPVKKSNFFEYLNKDLREDYLKKLNSGKTRGPEGVLKYNREKQELE